MNFVSRLSFHHLGGADGCLSQSKSKRGPYLRRVDFGIKRYAGELTKDLPSEFRRIITWDYVENLVFIAVRRRSRVEVVGAKAQVCEGAQAGMSHPGELCARHKLSATHRRR